MSYAQTHTSNHPPILVFEGELLHPSLKLPNRKTHSLGFLHGENSSLSSLARKSSQVWRKLSIQRISIIGMKYFTIVILSTKFHGSLQPGSHRSHRRSFIIVEPCGSLKIKSKPLISINAFYLILWLWAIINYYCSITHLMAMVNYMLSSQLSMIGRSIKWCLHGKVRLPG